MNSSSSLLQCKIIVEGKDYSDGEQHYLPVLSNRMLVTESLPMSIYEEEITNLRLIICYIIPLKRLKIINLW